MKKPKPVRVAGLRTAEYPTLTEFAADRRAFIKRLALGAVAVGFVGPISACFSDHQRDPEDVVTITDTGADVLSDGGAPPTDTGPDALHFDAYEEEMPSPGAMPYPEFYPVRLPATGVASTYIALDGYLTWAVTFQTDDWDFDAALRADELAGITVCADVLAAKTCEDLGPEEDLDALYQALTEALGELSMSLIGWRASIDNLQLLVGVCDAYGPIDGDMIDPDYP